MAHFILKKYRRARPSETRGTYDGNVVEFDAADQETAIQEAYSGCDEVNWGTHFVGLWSDDNQFLAIWGANPNA